MFYAHFVLSKKGPLARIWLAAHWDKKLTRSHVMETSITSSVQAILEPKVKMALRTSGHLMLGVVRIYSHKAKYLLNDCNQVFVKIKMSFRPGVAGEMQTLTPGATDADDMAIQAMAGYGSGPSAGLGSSASINLPPSNIHDFEATIADLSRVDDDVLVVNQSRPEDITMRDDFYGVTEINLGRQDDDFGESTSVYGGADEDDALSLISSRHGWGHDTDSLHGLDSMSHHESQEMRRGHHSGDSLRGVWPGGGPDGSSLHLGKKRPAEFDSLMDGMGGKRLHHDHDDEPDAIPDLFGDFIDEDDAALLENVFNDATVEQALEHLTHGPGRSGESAFDKEVVQGASPSVLEMPPSHFTVSGEESGLHAHATEPISAEAPATDSAIASTPAPSSAKLVKASLEGLMPPPSDTNVTEVPKRRRATKRQQGRLLIIDEQKSIPSDVMKRQMNDTSDITAQFDLAPPTKKLMQWKETGGVEKLLTMPGRTIASRCLQRLFTRNLRTAQPSAGGTTGDYPLWDEAGNPISQPLQPQFQHYLQNAQSSSAFCNFSLPPATPMLPPVTPFQPPIPEVVPVIAPSHEDLSHHLLPPETPGFVMPQEDEADQFPFDVFPARTPGVAVTPGYHHLEDTTNVTGAGVEDYPADSSMLALEREMMEADDNDDEDDDAIKGNEVAVEEKRLEKRSKVLLRMIDATLEHSDMHLDTSVEKHVIRDSVSSNSEPVAADSSCVSFYSMCKRNVKKQAAAKFYTLLLLKKQSAVDLFQNEPFQDIFITKGKRFDSCLVD